MDPLGSPLSTLALHFRNSKVVISLLPKGINDGCLDNLVKPIAYRIGPLKQVAFRAQDDRLERSRDWELETQEILVPHGPDVWISKRKKSRAVF